MQADVITTLQRVLIIFLLVVATLSIRKQALALETFEGYSEISDECSLLISALRKLSDSTVYSTLEISRVHSAVRENGIFHNNLILEVELSSPFFRSGLESENFTVVVMTSKADDVKSFAIDEFPVMHDVAIESFYNEKVVQKRHERERSLRWLDVEATRAAFNQFSKGRDLNSRPINSADSAVLSTLALMDDLDSVAEIRRRVSDRIRQQLPNDLLEEEVALSQMTLKQLYSATVDEVDVNCGDARGSDASRSTTCLAGNGRNANSLSEYQKYRARKILDSVFSDIYL
jgi:hypothetical protein